MVKYSDCFRTYRYWTYFILLLSWYVVTSAADNGGQLGLSVNKCVWNVFYSMEPILHEQGFQLYFKTSSDSCQSKIVNLELFQARWSNVTKCVDLDHLRTISLNKTEDQNFWYTNLETGNYCILIKPLARACSECHASFTGLATVLPSRQDETNRTLTKKESASGHPNAASLYLAASAVLLISAATSLLFFLKIRTRMTPKDEESDDGSSECTCGSSQPLLGTEVFILHTCDTWHRSDYLCQTLNDLKVSSTLVSTLGRELFTPPMEWPGERIARAKVVVVESEGAIHVLRSQLKQSGIHGTGEPGTEPGSSQQDEFDYGYTDRIFLSGLTSIMSDPIRRFLGYDRVFVVRFPSTPRDLEIPDLVSNVRFCLPKHFPDLCRHLLGMNCHKCLAERYPDWMKKSDEYEFRTFIGSEMPEHHAPVLHPASEAQTQS